ncbi:MAG: hypothetical protein M3436_18285 [Pseudomonadota bacterium]|nr:hypothetical protein [Pseudomonadota bacterium]
MVHQVARQLPQFEAYFTPYYCLGQSHRCSALIRSTWHWGGRRRATRSLLRFVPVLLDPETISDLRLALIP